ncbi:MAG: hypothetical protein A2Z21_03740 [Candidatus Fraserbacteria bacterium RBG_16_55_9]|uniref:EfeO-type cupredoxin-like domain-containing protein n=1 Tax=Fraserbacteria sp. (strain RBG_16_55_9) TaxID=1817864 RepID=A0A1F5UNE9_FRAXR|nr:MAG: hypothetical protein A2Z21_03740 [Candidatus Fraserbacteria bacterium RBG_16_55_9]
MERVIAIIVILAAVALIGFSLFGPKSSPPPPGARDAAFTLTEYAITPNRITMESGRVKLTFANQGNNIHQVEIYDTVEQRVVGKIELLRPKSTTILWVDITGGRRYQIYDPVWRKRGMEALIITQ